MSELMYYKSCGRIVQKSFDRVSTSCDCCNSEVYPVPKEFLVSETVPVMKRDLKKQFIDEYVKKFSEFDQNAFNRRDGILAQKNAKYREVMEKGEAIIAEKNMIARCFNCGSTNVSKISTLNRMMSTGLFGLASSKIAKMYKYNNCETT